MNANPTWKDPYIFTYYFLYLFLIKSPEDGHTNIRNVGKITNGFLLKTTWTAGPSNSFLPHKRVLFIE